VPEIVIIAAVARNRVIGKDNKLLWNIPEDMAHFKALTSGHTVIMGRKTWESLPPRFRPLPGRRNLVVTRNPDWQAEGAEAAASLEDALARLERVADPGKRPSEIPEGPPTARPIAPPTERAFVIGGGELYAQALPLADALELTEIDADFDADTFFPPWDRRAFTEVSRQNHVSEAGWRYAFVGYRRNPGG
jgi:dihydrofolate reductase